MSKLLHLGCYSHQEFDDLCETNGWNDECCPEGIAFISIIGTQECQDYYIEEKEFHWFKQPHPNVLNLEFDDISEDVITWEGHNFYGLSMEDGKRIVDFIMGNLGKPFYIHCRAGRSRSQGIVRFILDTFPEYGYTVRSDNPPETPNIDVLCKLKRIYRYR